MATCRSCGSEIRWVRMRSGKSMPVDGKMVAALPPAPEETGEVLITESGDTVRGIICDLDYSNKEIMWPCYRPHWASCPYADQHRKK